MNTLHGLKVVTDDSMTETVWVFPQDRFVEYEPKDEWWCRKYGIGHEVTRPRAEAVQVGDTLVMHPQMWEKLKEQTRVVDQVAARALTLLEAKVVRSLADEEWGKLAVPPARVPHADDFMKAMRDFADWDRLVTEPLRPRVDWDIPMLSNPSGEVDFRTYSYTVREAFQPRIPVQSTSFLLSTV